MCCCCPQPQVVVNDVCVTYNTDAEAAAAQQIFEHAGGFRFRLRHLAKFQCKHGSRFVDYWMLQGQTLSPLRNRTIALPYLSRTSRNCMCFLPQGAK